MSNTKTILAEAVKNYIQQMGSDAIKHVHTIDIKVNFWVDISFAIYELLPGINSLYWYNS